MSVSERCSRFLEQPNQRRELIAPGQRRQTRPIGDSAPFHGRASKQIDDRFGLINSPVGHPA
jgi:hypothetical protein